MTSQKLNEEHEILRRFMAVVVSSAFRDSLPKLVCPVLAKFPQASFARAPWGLKRIKGEDLNAGQNGTFRVTNWDDAPI